MFRRQECLIDFNWGMSVLLSYVQFNNCLNLHDINIISEDLFCKVVNILLGSNFHNSNKSFYNTAGFDLIDTENKIIMQVTSTVSTRKVKETFMTLQNMVNAQEEMTLLKNKEAIWKEKVKEEREKKNNNGETENTDIYSFSPEERHELSSLKKQFKDVPMLFGYTVKFLFLTSNNAENLKRYNGTSKKGYFVPPSLIFDPYCDILTLSDLSSLVAHLDDTTSEFTMLETYIKQNPELFRKISPLNTTVGIDKIIDEYAKNFEAPLFRHVYSENTQISLRNTYIDPAFSHENSLESSRNFVSLFSKFIWEDSNLRMLFIFGDAAIGKTSLISWLCFHYREISREDSEESIGKAIFSGKRVVVIRMRDLDFSQGGKVQDAIFSYLKIKNPADFYQDYSGAVIVLEGVDELSAIESVSVSSIEQILQDIRKYFKENKIIVTSRPRFIDMSSFLTSNAYKTKQIFLSHYDYGMRKEWIEKYVSVGGEISEETEQYIMDLDDTAAEGVADTPLALYLLASCEVKEELKDNNWALYHEIFRKAIINTEYNENFTTNQGHPINKDIDTIYSVVERIAFKMFQISKTERYYIDSEELDQIIHSLNGSRIPLERIRSCCVLCSYWKHDTTTGILEFYHNNIRDFFFAEFIYERLLLCANSQCEFGVDTFSLIQTLCDMFQYGFIHGTTWEQTFSFLYLRLEHEYKNRRNYPSNWMLHINSPDFFCRVTLNVITCATVFEYHYGTPGYAAVKHSIINIIMTLRILSEIYVCSSSEHILKLWSSETERTDLYASNIFRDWHEMFLSSIRISPNHIISLGSRTLLDGLDLHGLSLDHSVFSGSKLNYANFSNSSLVGALFSNTTLSNVDFRGAILRDTDFRGANLNNVSFLGADLTGAIFSEAHLHTINWENHVLSGVSISGAKFENCNLNGVTLSQIMEHTIFLDTQLIGARFSNIEQIKDVTFENSFLQNARFLSCTLNNTTFINSDLMHAIFLSVNLKNVTFPKTSLEYVDFRAIIVDPPNSLDFEVYTSPK